MSTEIILPGTYPANASAIVTGRLVDLDGVTPVAGSALSTLAYTLYEARTGAVINGRRATSILNENGGVIDEDGNLQLRLDAADMARVGTADSETHVALVEGTWASPARTLRAWILFTVAAGPAVAPVTP